MEKSLYTVFLEKRIEMLESIEKEYYSCTRRLAIMTSLALLGWTTLVVALCVQL